MSYSVRKRLLEFEQPKKKFINILQPRRGLARIGIIKTDNHIIQMTVIKMVKRNNLVWNNYLSNVSAEMSANVSVLRDFLLFRDNSDLCSHLCNTDDIACFIISICTGWFTGVCVRFYLSLYLFCTS